MNIKLPLTVLVTILGLITSLLFHETKISTKRNQNLKDPLLFTEFHFENKKMENDPITIGLCNDISYPKAWLIGVGWFERYTSDGRFVFDDRYKITEKTPPGDKDYVCDLWKIMNDDADSKAAVMPAELKKELNSLADSEIHGDTLANIKKYTARIDLLKTASFYEYTPKYSGFIAFKGLKIDKIVYGKNSEQLLYFELHVKNHKAQFLKLDDTEEIVQFLTGLKNRYDN